MKIFRALAIIKVEKVRGALNMGLSFKRINLGIGRCTMNITKLTNSCV